MEIKKLENSSVQLTLTLGAAAIEEDYSKTIKDYAKKLTLKGFRPGKAPLSLIESKYGDAIREEVTFRLMEKNLTDSYKDMDAKDRPLPYSTPELQNEESLLPFKPNTDVTYSVIYDVLPQVKLPAYKGLEIEYEAKKVTEKDVNEEIERLRQQNAMVIAKNGAIADGDIVTLDYVELDADGKEMEATKRDDFTFTVGSSYNFYKLDKDIIGMKKGDSSVIEKTYGDDSGMGTDYLGKTVKIKVTVKEVKIKEVPALDDDFAQDVKDEYKTVADLLKATKKQLEDAAENENKSAKLDAIVNSLLEKTEIAVPKSMVEAQLESDWQNFISRFGMNEADVLKIMGAQGGSKEQFLETRRADTLQNIKAQLIIEQVKEEQKYEVKEDELAEELKNYGEDITKDSPNYESMKIYAEDDIKFRKARDFLLENNTFKAASKKADKAEEKKEPKTKKEPAKKETTKKKD
ncbi:MAG: trigger factor [Spirochaetales bacterium]|nr:trigger factor [Spirochaetales bacterium]MBP5756325.1 trigger factor [Spirochaetales bacterium]